jgi:hypothetical protein
MHPNDIEKQFSQLGFLPASTRQYEIVPKICFLFRKFPHVSTS